VALVITLIMLSVVTITAVAFLTVARRERAAVAVDVPSGGRGMHHAAPSRRGACNLDSLRVIDHIPQPIAGHDEKPIVR
jgi:uncharacterized membrane protein